MLATTNMCLSGQQTCVCQVKHMFVATNIILLRQKFCCGKRTFVATKDMFCCDKHMFAATKIILVAAPANDTGLGVCHTASSDYCCPLLLSQPVTSSMFSNSKPLPAPCHALTGKGQRYDVCFWDYERSNCGTGRVERPEGKQALLLIQTVHTQIHTRGHFFKNIKNNLILI